MAARKVRVELKKAMLDADYRNFELADDVGISEQEMSAITQGRRKNVRQDVKKRIAEVLQTPIEKLFPGE